ncbi:hypothetical protein [Legionella bozemanae]|uniref:hypothetical protein n=1 Tax=Legionella bozemanae TaxID=447 RepID=UPI001040E774|nr:hypothetical protein [Legionella bozemanae]
MNTPDEALVIEAAEKYGFNIEFKTKSLFQTKGYNTEINKFYYYEGELLAVDVHAELHDRLFLVECKGTASNSMLVLIKDPDKSESIYVRREIDNYDSRIMGFGGAGLFCTFTGDFFSKEQNKLKKLSKNDTENNFYKAQTQITNAIHAVSWDIQQKSATEENPIHIMPLIVTNAHIWVIDYEQNPISATNHKWVKHKVVSNKLPIFLKEDRIFTYLVNIVNVNYLQEFLDKSHNMNRSYGTIDTLNNTLV